MLGSSWQLYDSSILKVLQTSRKVFRYPGLFLSTTSKSPSNVYSFGCDRDYVFPKENLRKSSFQNSTT